ncbi:MAG: hypothetical protein ACKVW3_09430 [Phycisphaerales bacterium]
MNDHPNALDRALKKLGTQESWRLTSLPKGVTVDVMRVLDTDGYVEVRGWYLKNTRTGPHDPNPMAPRPSDVGWYSPTAAPLVFGTWDQLFEKSAKDVRTAAEVRISEKGKAKLARMTMLRKPRGTPKPSEPLEKSSKSGSEWLTVTEAAVLLGLRTYEVSRLASNGDLKTNGKVYHERRITAASVARYKLADNKDKTIATLRKHVG